MTSNKTAMSKDDKFVMEQLTKTQEIYDGRYRFGMPWKTAPELIESNHKVAEKRAMLLQRKLKSSDQFLADGYKQAMDKYLNHDYARKLNASDVNINENGTWYIPHHAVIHPKKKKVRVVFDCAAKHRGKSLNDHLYQESDLANTPFIY